MTNKIKYISYLNKNQILSCDLNNILRIWDPVTGDLIKEIFDTENTIINSLNLSPDKKIYAFDKNNIKFFDLNTYTWMNMSINLRIKGYVNMCWLSNTTIVLGYGDGILEIHDIENGAIVKSWEAFDELINEICLSPDDSQFAVSSHNNNFIKIYNSNSYELVSFIESNNNIKNFTYSLIDDLIVSINWKNVIEIWNCRTGLLVKRNNEIDKENIKYIYFSPTGDHLIIFTKNRVKILYWESTDEILSFTHQILSFNTHEISDLCLIPDFNNNLINRIDNILDY